MKYTLVTLNVKKKYDETNGLSSAQDQPLYKHHSKTKNRHVPTLLYTDELHEKTYHLCLRLSKVHTVSSKSRRLHI
jgi:hypothetical protein